MEQGRRRLRARNPPDRWYGGATRQMLGKRGSADQAFWTSPPAQVNRRSVPPNELAGGACWRPTSEGSSSFAAGPPERGLEQIEARHGQ
jgi:hypothetical protein